MKMGIRILFATALVLLSAAPLFARGGFLNAGPQLSPPQLVSPTSDIVDLKGKDSLEFKWIIIDGIRVDHCEFKLYKGYDMLQSTLLLKQEISSDSSSLTLKSSTFQDGQVYTWSVKEIGTGGQKSDRSYSSFKVIKK